MPKIYDLFQGSGRDTWDERPYNKESTDWDDNNSPNRYRDRSYDDDYEVEKEDSDNESKHNYTNNVKKNKDVEQISSPTHLDKKVNINLNASLNNSPKKTNKPVKKVDLGAAANFGRDATQSPTPVTGNINLQPFIT